MIWYQVNPDYYSKFLKIKKLYFGETFSLYTLLTSDLDRIKSMNFDGVWLMPLFIRATERDNTSSPYAIKEFIFDTKWGSFEELENLIDNCHRLGLKIITEYVPNHIAWDSPYQNISDDFVFRDSKGHPRYDQDWGDTIKLNNLNPKVQEFARKNLEEILGEFGFDGLRLDMAHYLFYDVDYYKSNGRNNPLFWHNVFSQSNIDTNKLIIFTEVYDDRNKEYNGYGDQIQLLKEGLIPYDKKTHEIVSHKLKNIGVFNIQDSLYAELLNQHNAISISGIKKSITPFLRIPCNHDDAPGIKNFGGVREYICALAVLTLINGHCMIYAGDEYGLLIKPSVTGRNYYDERGNLTESNEIFLIPELDQNLIHSSILKLLDIRRKICKDNNQKIYLARVTNYNDGVANDILCFFRMLDGMPILICVNASHDNQKKWGSIHEFYPDIETNETLTLKDFLKNCFKDKEEYNVTEILTQKDLGKRNIYDDIIISLDPLEVQILQFSL